MGQLVVVTRADDKGKLQRYYMTADAPDWNIEDVRAMGLEEKAKEGISPQEFLDSLARVQPVEDAFIVKRDAAPGTDGTWWGAASGADRGTRLKFSQEKVWDGLPHFNWYQIFNFVDHELEKKSKKAKK